MSTNKQQQKQGQNQQAKAEKQTQQKPKVQQPSTDIKPEAAVETPAAETAKVEVKADPEPAKAEVKTEQVEEAVIETPEAAKAVVKAIAEYATAMAPNRPVDAKDVNRQQVKLNHTITVLLEQTPADKFNVVFGHALLEVEKNLKGAFSDRLLFRGMDNIQLPTAQVSKFQSALVLLVEAAPAQDRARRMKNIDLNVTLKGYSESVRAKVQAFFKK